MPASSLLQPVRFEQDDPRARGRAHGELWRPQIHELAELRVQLCLERAGYTDRDALDRVAAAHLPVLAAQEPALHQELLGIAEGADLSPERVLVLNHYTDLRDIPGAGGGGEPDGCTAIYLCGEQGAVLGQTWDMHATAAPFVRVMHLLPPGGAEVLCLTLTGCLGLAGLGQHGVAVTINNLNSTDARVGLVWPALVRSMLAANDARAAYERLLAAPLSSGHHYMIADGRAFFGVECSGELKVLTQVGPKAAHLHTNHCFDPVLRGRERLVPGTTSFARLDMATTLYAQQQPATSTACGRCWAATTAIPAASVPTWTISAAIPRPRAPVLASR
ncbi:MAG: C45 family peptidase [Nannocystaceae bacterium]